MKGNGVQREMRATFFPTPDPKLEEEKKKKKMKGKQFLLFRAVIPTLRKKGKRERNEE